MNETKSLFMKKINKTDKALARPTTKKKVQTTKIRNESGHITINQQILMRMWRK